MTPEDLSAIRDRVERERSAPFLYASQGDQARTDRAALLAEVDRLQALIIELGDTYDFKVDLTTGRY